MSSDVTDLDTFIKKKLLILYKINHFSLGVGVVSHILLDIGLNDLYPILG